ncbi:hypothetical protein GCM10009639_51840 [Kitasatospora putterlickiae]|uniref:Knr4/Smi1-like domain-containing protein n=1 Tax=Kitasatospora putterlickiae TaxID=221725 RepID=A0ABP4J3R8_9ACTN
MTLHDDTPAVRSEEWEATLAQAFGEVLGRPLAEYDGKARYGAYYSGNFLAETELDRDPRWVGRAVLAGEETVAQDHLLLTPPGDLDETALVFDASRSLFHVESRGLPAELAAFAAELAAAVEEAGHGRWNGALLGADLGRIAERHGVDLASPGLPGDLWTLWRVRLASGDTLLDALLAATGLTAATSPELMPRGLGDSADEVDDEAHEHVAEVADPALRDYLAAFCDPESHDLALALYGADGEDGEGDDDGDGEDEDDDVVISWEGAVDQYEITVHRLEP